MNPPSVLAASRVVGRMLWPLRSIARSKGVPSRSLTTGWALLKKDCLGGCESSDEGAACAKSCNKRQEACPPKPPKCKPRPCLPPCHACPQEDPCWHCPYVPPPCPKRKPCCPICPIVNPYEYKDTCCPPTDYCKKKCVQCDPPPPPPRRLTRCERPGAFEDPCCSRTPKCPDPCLKPGEKKPDDCESDCPERPTPPDPCKIEGEICSFDDCEFKKPEVCCSQIPKDPKCCPRRQKAKKKKRVIKESCCLDLDPNWPPKRPECECGFPNKEDGPCQQTIKQKKDFWDGLC